MKRITMILSLALSCLVVSHASAQAWRTAPYVDPSAAYYGSAAYGPYGQAYTYPPPPVSYGSCMPPQTRCSGYGSGRNTTTVVVVQPERQMQMCDGYYSNYTNGMGQRVWNMNPVTGTAMPYDPYYSGTGYVDPYYSGTSMSAGRQAAIIGLQAADMVGSQFIQLAIRDIMYRP